MNKLSEEEIIEKLELMEYKYTLINNDDLAIQRFTRPIPKGKRKE